MAFTESNMMPLGTRAPEFDLPDAVSGQRFSFEKAAGERATVVMFLCNHCPYVLWVNPEIVRITKDFAGLGARFLAISSNDVDNYPQDRPALMKPLAEQYGFSFPYLFDETQAVARAYDAACTPDFYIFDGQKNLAYRGRLDASTPRNGQPLTGADLRAALAAIIENRSVPEPQRPSGGCNIKWKPV